MPRTKIPKNESNKRNRKSSNEDKLHNSYRVIAEMYDAFITDVEYKLSDELADIKSTIQQKKTKTPNHILQMKLGDLKKTAATTIDELILLLAHKQISKKSTLTAHHNYSSSVDDGYNSEQSNTTSLSSGTSATSRAGPLASGLAKGRRRRSKSVDITKKSSNTSTPVNHPPSHSSAISAGGNARLSRNRSQMPLGPRLKASSVDRYATITPKVKPNTPLAFLRHPRPGEQVFSITGSPVITSHSCGRTANVIIPIRNGILSMMPNKLRDADVRTLKTIDSNTLEHLKTLQTNLNNILETAKHSH